jgi:glycerol-3-phosphate dehydrogenase
VVRSLGGSRWRQRCRTRRLRLHGAGTPTEPPIASLTGLGRHLAERYGTDASHLHALIESDPTLGEPLVRGLGYVRAEAVYAVTDEMAISLSDVLVRRTQAHYRDRRACEEAADDIARLIAPLLGWDQGTIDHQVALYRSLCETERITASIRDDSSASTITETTT